MSIIIEEVGPGIYSLFENFVRMYLVSGNDRALLIDTGLGGDNLRQKAEKLSDKPYDVVITHNHYDHIGGTGEFESVYAHGLDKTFIKCAVNEIADGKLFELGGVTLETVHIPGHTPGSIALYDRKRKLLFGNDTLQEGPVFLYAPNCDCENYIKSLKRLKTLDFDLCYTGHHRMTVDKSYADDLIELTALYLQKKLRAEPFESNGETRYIYRHKRASIFGKPELSEE